MLKDIVNGVPTAYDDLEKLLTNSEDQLQKMYGSMPPFLQTLVRSLPKKMTSSLGPELLVMAAAKGATQPGTANVETSSANRHKHGNSDKKKNRLPSLRTIVTKQGVAVSMLRSILQFLKFRFPAIIGGTNVLMSLAVFCE